MESGTDRSNELARQVELKLLDVQFERDNRKLDDLNPELARTFRDIVRQARCLPIRGDE